MLVPMIGKAQSLQEPISVRAQKDGETIVVDAAFSVPVTPREAWDVLTDFDRMEEFVSNLQYSKILSRIGNRLQVAQKGRAAHGLISFVFESIRDVDLVPYQSIRTRLVSGNMKKLEGLTVLTPEPGGTRVSYHGESIPGVWVPPVFGLRFIEKEVAEQFDEIRDEILKRKGIAR